MSKISIQKQVFNKTTFPKVVDTQFKQLIDTTQANSTPSFTLEDFFTLYEQLFFQIPKEGDTNSHQFILEKEAEYLGINLNTEDVQALLAEITALRQEITSAQQTIQTLSVSSPNGQ
jgi:uncharacterized protein YozE (UPF0346 family)